MAKKHLPNIWVSDTDEKGRLYNRKLEGEELIKWIYMMYPSNKKTWDKYLPLDILETAQEIEKATSERSRQCYFDRNKNYIKMNKDYTDYINSKQWKIKRELVLDRDNHECQECGVTEKLHVHHLSYEHFKDEPLEDLITLCNKCHDKIHGRAGVTNG